MDEKLIDLSGRTGIESILVIRLKALGDIILSLPIVHALRSSFPRAWIGYLCRGAYAEALSGVTGLDEVISLPRSVRGQLRCLFDLRRRHLDLVIDLLSSPRSALVARLAGGRIRIGMDVGRHNWCYHQVLPRVIMKDGRRVRSYTLHSNRELVRMLGLAGGIPGGRGGMTGSGNAVSSGGTSLPSSGEVDGGDLAIGFPAADLEYEWAGRYIEGVGVDPSMLVGLAPAATYGAKSWPKEHFIELARLLVRELRVTPVVLWGPGEEGIADEIAERAGGTLKAPPTGIARLGALIRRLRLLVTVDSGPKHMAVVQGVPTVTLFGPTDPRIWDPQTERHRVLYRGLPCSPCRRRECEPNSCLADISPREVADAVSDMMQLPYVSGPPRTAPSR